MRTLFDVAAAARQAAKEPKFIDLKNSWPALAEYWRLKQLQYTWLRAITSSHTDFWQVTKESLDWALEKNWSCRQARNAQTAPSTLLGLTTLSRSFRYAWQAEKKQV